MNTCNTCFYYDAETRVDYNCEYGNCHRYPPISEVLVRNTWWCGEHREEEKVNEDKQKEVAS